MNGKKNLEKNELLIREIIDIDSSYIEAEENDPILKKNKQKEKKATTGKLDKPKEDLLNKKE